MTAIVIFTVDNGEVAITGAGLVLLILLAVLSS